MIKLINGDFLSADFSEISPIDLIFTSPPYNVGISYLTHNDMMNYEDYLKWTEKWILKCFLLQSVSGRIVINIPFTNTPLYIKKKGEDPINYPMASDLTHICQKVGYKYYRTIVWKKMGGNKTSWGSWRSASSPAVIDPSEALLVFYKKQWKKTSKGTSTISGKDFMTYIKNVWEIQPETRSKHPAAFNIKLANAVIKMFSYKEDIIMDCFLGSGTTGESALRLGRNFIGVEMNKDYFDMAKERIDTAELQTSLIKSIMPDGDEED